MKFLIRFKSYYFLTLFISLFVAVSAQEGESNTPTKCFDCHGNKYYSFYNEMEGKSIRKPMNPFFVIDSISYKEGVHHTFSCDDCHSPDYEKYPHNAALKLEPQYTCQDCHSGDDHFAHLHFDEIEAEAQKSVHYKAFGDNFKCELCHDPHTYKLIASSEKYNVKEIVSLNNEICLSCHMNETKFHILTDKESPKIIQKHDWLPNQALHFQNVRCIECHTSVNDTLMVSHQILPGKMAVRKCVECHSTNTLLQNKLYKYMSKELRQDKGFYNSVILNEAYVIGANRNKYLNIISIIIFGCTLLGIIIHLIFRIFKRK